MADGYYENFPMLYGDENNADLISKVCSVSSVSSVSSATDIKLNKWLKKAICRNCPTAIKMLIKKGADVNVLLKEDSASLHFSAISNVSTIELLSVAGANWNTENVPNTTVLLYAMVSGLISITDSPKAVACVKTLIANGARLKYIENKMQRIDPWVIAFEKGVLNCRSATIALLALKRRGAFKKQDRFIIRELGIAIWATRYDPKWQPYYYSTNWAPLIAFGLTTLGTLLLHKFSKK
jgi:hypothetical protein